MLKIIDNLKDKIITVTQKQLKSSGYTGTTIRSIAEECGIAVGTVYNYFPDKDTLVSMSMMGDWLTTLASMKHQCGESENVVQGMRYIYDLLEQFVKEHPWMSEYRATVETATSDVFMRHKMMRGILDDILMELFEKHGKEEDVHLCPLFAEMIIVSVCSSDIEFALLEDIAKRLFD